MQQGAGQRDARSPREEPVRFLFRVLLIFKRLPEIFYSTYLISRVLQILQAVLRTQVRA